MAAGVMLHSCHAESKYALLGLEDFSSLSSHRVCIIMFIEHYVDYDMVHIIILVH